MRVWLTLMFWLAIAAQLASCEDAGDAPARSFSLATWCWEAECVLDEQVRANALAFAKTHAIDSIYIQPSLDYQEPTLFKELEALARSAQSQGMSLRWVEGRPEWAFTDHRAEALAALEQAAAINLQLMAAGRAPLREIVYDVEPWALTEWEDDPGTLIHAFVALVESLHAAAARAGLALWVALPFWFETVAAAEAPGAASEDHRGRGLTMRRPDSRVDRRSHAARAGDGLAYGRG